MLNVVIPMAGRGSRFAKVGYEDPKPLIKIDGVEMTRLVIANLRPKCEHRFIFLCLKEHIDKYNLDEKLKSWTDNCVIVPVDTVTEGAACTVLLAKQYIDNDDNLMIANSDQWIDYDINKYLDVMQTSSADGLIMTMKATDPKWSFVEFDPTGNVIAVREKQPVSDEATVGIYNFKKGKDFVRGAEQMIAENHRENGEFYVAPVYDYLIADNKKIAICNIGNAMYGIGTPEDLNLFLTLDVCKKAVKAAVL